MIPPINKMDVWPHCRDDFPLRTRSALTAAPAEGRRHSGIGPVTTDAWLTSHPYLKGVADLHAIVGVAATGTSSLNLAALSLDDYRDDFLRGVPLLHSATITIDWTPVEKGIQRLAETLVSSPLPGNLTEEAQRCAPNSVLIRRRHVVS